MTAGIEIGIGNILQKVAKFHVKKVTAKMKGSIMYHSSMKVFEICGSRERAELQWLQDPSQINVDNLNSVTCETSKPLRKKHGNKQQTNEFQTNNKHETYIGAEMNF